MQLKPLCFPIPEPGKPLKESMLLPPSATSIAPQHAQLPMEDLPLELDLLILQDGCSDMAISPLTPPAYTPTLSTLQAAFSPVSATPPPSQSRPDTSSKDSPALTNPSLSCSADPLPHMIRWSWSSTHAPLSIYRQQSASAKTHSANGSTNSSESSVMSHQSSEASSHSPERASSAKPSGTEPEQSDTTTPARQVAKAGVRPNRKERREHLQASPSKNSQTNPTPEPRSRVSSSHPKPPRAAPAAPAPEQKPRAPAQRAKSTKVRTSTAPEKAAHSKPKQK